MTDTNTSAPAAPAPADPAPLAPATPAAAREQINKLTDNREWSARWLAGGIAEAAEYKKLSELADQADQIKEALDGTTPESNNLIQTLGPNELSTRDLASAVDMFRDKGLDDLSIQQLLRGGEVSRAEYMAAKAMKNAKLGDPEWTKRWLAGGWNEGREMLLINTIVSSFQE